MCTAVFVDIGLIVVIGLRFKTTSMSPSSYVEAECTSPCVYFVSFPMRWCAVLSPMSCGCLMQMCQEDVQDGSQLFSESQ